MLTAEEIKELVKKYPRVLETMEQPYKGIVERLVKNEKLDRVRRGDKNPSPH